MDDEFYVFGTRDIWLELNVPKMLLREKTSEYFEGKKGLLCSDVAIALLLRLTGNIRQKMLCALEAHDVRVTLLDLIKILNRVHSSLHTPKRSQSKDDRAKR